MGKPLDCAALREAVETWPELDRLRQLREAIRHWAVGPHTHWCASRAEGSCDCGTDDEFEARLTACKLVGLTEDEP